ncbi:MAG: hypothetical protein Ct9H300mP25_06280 [Acidobacteriota bacterium]|nr:MAG: hypothetical protein Ct9H300mP25_06280 [Acidobacteriota bacterium]
MSVMPEAVIGTLRWLCGVLHREKISFQVIGDIAMPLEGPLPSVSTVELFVSADSLPQLMRVFEGCITEYPWRRRNEQWDLIMMGLNNGDVVVSIGVSDGARMRAGTSAKWEDVVIDFGASKVVTLEGVKIPIPSRTEFARELRLPTPREESS